MKSHLYFFSILTILLTAIFYTAISPLPLSADSDTSGSIGLSVIKTNDQNTASPGEVLTYRIVITNHKDENVTVRVVDHLPEFLLPLATSPSAEADPETRTIVWEQISIPANEEITLGLRAQIVDHVPHNHLIENKAMVTGESIELTAQDHTRVENHVEDTPAAPVAPTATTGTSSTVVFLALGALIGSIVTGKKLLNSQA